MKRPVDVVVRRLLFRMCAVVFLRICSPGVGMFRIYPLILGLCAFLAPDGKAIPT
jgi:hypothetical protein